MPFKPQATSFKAEILLPYHFSSQPQKPEYFEIFKTANKPQSTVGREFAKN